MKNGDYVLVLAPKDYVGKKYRGRYCYEHHLIYWLNYGVVPKDDEIIHHKDGNKHNNLIDNLELKKRAEHTKNHRKTGKTMIEVRCSFCGKLFVREKRFAHFLHYNTQYCCCSNECALSITHLNAEQKQHLNTPKIIREFLS